MSLRLHVLGQAPMRRQEVTRARAVLAHPHEAALKLDHVTGNGETSR
jgi:hypothetical protein